MLILNNSQRLEFRPRFEGVEWSSGTLVCVGAGMQDAGESEPETDANAGGAENHERLRHGGLLEKGGHASNGNPPNTGLGGAP